MKLAINQGTSCNASTEKFLELCHEYEIKAKYVQNLLEKLEAEEGIPRLSELIRYQAISRGG